MLVTISGLPGAGTTTAARLVSGELGLEWVNGGQIWRAMAAELGLTVADFSAYSEANPEVDLELDARLAARAAGGGCVLEARLAGWLATRGGLLAERVWVACDEQVRARRVAVREGGSPEEALTRNRAREASERLRYRQLYDIDIGDLSIYDMVLDSDELDPERLAAAVVTGARSRFGSGPGTGAW